MLIDLGEVLKETGNELKFGGNVPVECPKEEIDIEGPVVCNIDFVNAGGIIVADGRIKASVKMSCSRCLREFDLPVDLKISEQFARLEKAKRQEESGKHTAKHEVEVPDEDVIFPVNDDNKVDISEVIRQELILNMPEKPLCSKDCKGFSEGKKEKKIDPRLEKLKELF